MQAELYREDFETERRDRENAAGKMVEERADMTIQLQHQQEELKQQYEAEMLVLRSDLESEQKKLSTLSEKFDSCQAELMKTRQASVLMKDKLEASQKQHNEVTRRLEQSSEEARRLKEEVHIKTQQLRMYKKQADDYRAQMEGLQNAQPSEEVFEHNLPRVDILL